MMNLPRLISKRLFRNKRKNVSRTRRLSNLEGLEPRMLMDGAGLGLELPEPLVDEPAASLVAAEVRIISIADDVDLSAEGDNTVNSGLRNGSQEYNDAEVTPGRYLTAQQADVDDGLVIQTEDLRVVLGRPEGMPLADWAAEIDQQLGLRFRQSYYENWGGRGEKWLGSESGDWYFITADGDLYKWDGRSNLSTSRLVATIDTSYHADPSKLHDAELEQRADQLDKQLRLQFKNDYYHNWGQRNEKWIFSGQQNTWYFIEPDGALYKWNGQRDLSGSQQIAQLNARYHADPSLLHEATSLRSEELARWVDHEFDLSGAVSRPEDSLGLGEKWLTGANGEFYITPDGTLHREGITWDWTTIQLDATYHADPSKLHQADQKWLAHRAYDLDQQLGLNFHESYYENWGGRGEKWMRGLENWYFITPDGALHLWNRRGGRDLSTSPKVAILDASFFADPSKIHDASDPSQAFRDDHADIA